MTGRLAAAVGAVAAVLGLVAWGLGSPHAGQASAHAARPQIVLRTPSPSTASPGGPPGAPGGWRLKFDAAFRGSRLDAKVWDTCYPWVKAGAGCTNFGNREYEWYQPSQVRVSGGALRLAAQHVPTVGQNSSGAPKNYACRSGMVTSYPGFRFKYGYVQVVARVPLAPGLWPALWLAAADLHTPPEIDILEHWGKSAKSSVFLHPIGAGQEGTQTVTGNIAAGWHTFGVQWTSKQVVWFIDGRAVYSTHRLVPHQRMYFIANVAEYRRTHRGCDGTMVIRSVKVWRQA